MNGAHHILAVLRVHLSKQSESEFASAAARMWLKMIWKNWKFLNLSKSIPISSFGMMPVQGHGWAYRLSVLLIRTFPIRGPNVFREMQPGKLLSMHFFEEYRTERSDRKVGSNHFILFGRVRWSMVQEHSEKPHFGPWQTKHLVITPIINYLVILYVVKEPLVKILSWWRIFRIDKIF